MGITAKLKYIEINVKRHSMQEINKKGEENSRFAAVLKAFRRNSDNVIVD